MPDAKSFGDRIRQFAVFDDHYGAAYQVASAVGKIDEVLIRLRADRTLRAMLENNDGIGLRPIQELFEITILY